jgi:hypothetical protein
MDYALIGKDLRVKKDVSDLPMRGALSRRLQSQSVFVLGSVLVHGLCSTNLSREHFDPQAKIHPFSPICQLAYLRCDKDLELIQLSRKDSCAQWLRGLTANIHSSISNQHSHPIG